jgi:hypothetical protein
MKRMAFQVMMTVTAVMAASLVHAQEIDLRELATKMRENQEELRNYSWDTKVTFLVNDQFRRVDNYTVRYVMGGMTEKMQINSKVAKEKVRRANGKKLSKKELEAARVFLVDVKNQIDGYLNPLFAEKAIANAKVLHGDGGEVLLVSQNVMTSGDSVEIKFGEYGRKPVSATIKTIVEGAPVALDIEFGSMEYGPNYTARSITTSQWQEFKVSFVTENTNYHLSQQ